MKAGMRASERWFRRALWLVALVFAFFLIGLGSLVVGDLPQVEHRASLEQFLDPGRAKAAAEALKAVRRERDDVRRETAQVRLALESARAASAAGQETLANWLRTRDATQRVDQDPGLVARTERLDALKAGEREVEERLEGLERRDLALGQREADALKAEEEVRAEARTRFEAAERGQELRVFAYRLAITLPLLVAAGWLLLRRRHGRNWPFVWGFAFAAAFAFFVELVPYMPSYGGYVQYGVGAIATVVAGRAAINAYQAYAARQREAETRPDEERRTEILTDQALARLARNTCPGCERPVALADPATNFCPHCGIGLFERCRACERRKSAFDRFCHACGRHSAGIAAEPA